MKSSKGVIDNDKIFWEINKIEIFFFFRNDYGISPKLTNFGIQTYINEMLFSAF